MVTNVTSLTGNGLKDWLIQRVSAVYLAVYVVWLFSYLLLNMPFDDANWQTLFHFRSVQIASLIALFLMLLHAWIGIWTVTTDYLKPVGIRLIIQMLVVLFLGWQFLWGFMIIWGQS